MAENEKQCQHCGAPYRGEGDFCCRGCEYVHQLILDEGLDRYYDLKDRTLPPIGSVAFQKRDDKGLVDAWKQSEEVAAGVLKKDYELKGISCVGCVWLIEKLYSKYEKGVGIDIDPQYGRITITAEREFALSDFASEIQRFGYTLREWDGKAGRISQGNAAGARLGVCGFLAMNVMAFNLPFYLGMELNDQLAPLLQFIVMILASFSVAVGGSFFFKRAIAAIRVGTLHIDLPIALGILVAYAGSFVGWFTKDPNLFYFDFIAIFVLLMLVGRWMQERVTEQNIRQGFEMDPSEQSLILLDIESNDNASSELNVRDVKSGMYYGIRNSQWIPVQSRIEMGKLDVSLESINGESEPKSFSVGETLPAGAIVLSQAEDTSFLALQDWSQSLLNRLFSISTTGNRESSRMELILKTYILVVIGLSLVGFLTWAFLIGQIKTGFQVGVSILVVSCPCAIGLAYPKANDLCARWLRGRGVYIRLHSLWGRIQDIKRIFFDKTGTLTLETLELLNPEELEMLNKEQEQALFGLVDRNLHPVGRSLKEHLLTKDPTLTRTSGTYPEVTENVGFGVAMDWFDCRFELNKSSDVDRLGETDLFVDGKRIASFRFSESVRKDASECIRWFEKNELEVTIISGDTPARVDELTKSLGLSSSQGVGGLTPAEKATWIDDHQPEKAMMVGDGANDALAFEKAGCRATPVIGRGILENHSDFFFLGQGVQGIVDVFKLSKLRGKILFEILSLTIFYNIIVVIISLMGWMNPLFAAILMPISSIVTVSWATIRLSGNRLNRDLS